MTRFNILEYLSNKNFSHAKLRGSEYSMCCPFHNEDRPSFSINIDTGQWLCRSVQCGKRGGSVTSFISKLESIPFNQAKDMVGSQDRYPISSVQELDSMLFDKQSRKKEIADTRLPEPHITHAKHTYPQYLINRGYPIDSGVAENFDLRVGVSSKYKDYLILPTYDVTNKYLSYTARLMDKEDKRRLRYTGPVFDLHHYVYGEWLLPTRPEGPIFIVEGQFDVMRLWTFGACALGTFGAGYTATQVSRMLDFAQKRPIVVLYDADTMDDINKTSYKLFSTLSAIGHPCQILDLRTVGVKDPDALNLEQWRMLYRRELLAIVK